MMKITIALILLFAAFNIKASKRPIVLPMPDTIANINSFNEALLNKIIYRGLAIENQNQGKLNVLFIIGNNRKAKYIQILQSPHDLISNMVLKALKEIEFPPELLSGQQYILPINFKLQFISHQSVISSNWIVPLPDSIQAKLAQPVSNPSFILYDADNKTIPGQKSIWLKEITKHGYFVLHPAISVY